MRHQRLRRKLGIKSQHRQALLRNLVRALITHKRIQTTHAKAKEASAFADKMITIAKEGTLHSRRLLVAKMGCADTAKALVKEIAPHFKDRNGGYTRVLRLGKWRAGDASEMALLEFTALIEMPEKAKKAKKPKKSKESKAEEVVAEKTKKEKPKQKEQREAQPPEAQKSKSEETAEKPKEKQETEKKGGFLGTLRKFLKGD